MRISRLIGVVFLAVVLQGCGKKARAPVAPGVDPDVTEVGIASWYGHPFHGRRTANGEVYDMDGMTAAHKTLPFGSVVEVQNLDNGKKTVVRINDRGPFVEGRIIDLTRKAAREIDMVGPGTARVRVRVLGQMASSHTPTRIYTVQVGAFRDKKNADKLRKTLSRSYRDVAMIKVEMGDRTFYRVRVGKLSDVFQARELAGQLQKESGVEAPVVLGISN